MTDKPTPREQREQLIERLNEAHLRGQMNSAPDRERWINNMLEAFCLARTADLCPVPAKQDAHLAPLPQRQPIDSLQKLAEARAKLIELERLEARLVSIAPLKRMPADDDKLRYTRHEIAALSMEIKMASAMERRAANG